MDGQPIKSTNACEEEQITKPRHKLWQELARQIGNAGKDERDRAKAHKIEQHEAAARDIFRIGHWTASMIWSGWLAM